MNQAGRLHRSNAKMAQDPQSLTKEDYARLAAFRAALRQFLAFSERAARTVGLMPQQHQALLAIKGGGGRVSVGELATRLGIRPNTAVELVDRLAAAGLVRRSGSADDGRRVLLALTAKAERMLAELSGAHLEELRRMAPMLGDLLASLRAGPDKLE
jgi:DNA-binding MarR family transcriptional regulator